ncbi:F-box/kelch-repeat protein At5g38670-like [Brassica rapa]|uniref:F-box/kelch-repeat protein At5g38670-like n=1 Tax=Brassica campestris TaxID=3711 RepID=UPI00142D1DA1|nr:F-box/kelch-repeat protein At5g38670-like [Brassica rapa]
MERLIKGDSLSTTREKKKKKLTSSSSSLPYDLLVMIVARVPRSYYRTLSLVSTSFRCMVVSPELYKVRSLLGLTETCLYVCLRFGFTCYKWYTLSSKSSDGGGYVLTRVLTLDDNSPRMMGLCYSDLVAVGSDIYNIGVADKNKTMPTSGVSILDCKTHRWRKSPRMPVELTELSARVLDRKIYVLGRRFHHLDGSWKSSFEVFNTNTQTWDLPSCGGFDSARINFLIDGKLHVVTLFDGVFAFDSKQCRWDLVEQYPSTGTMCSGSFCEVDNVLYSVSKDGALTWYDSDNTSWRDLNGLVGLPKLPSPLDGYGSYVKLTGYGGGKMMVFWNCNLGIHRPFQRDTIYCAEIALERRNGDCWGKLEWFDSMLLVPLETQFVKVLAVTL